MGAGTDMFIRCVACVGMLLLAQGVSASDRISVGVGDASGDIDAYRIGFQRDFKKRWWRDRPWGLSGYWEASANYWVDNDSISALAFSPVFTLSLKRSSSVTPYFEAGIGVALISNSEIERRNLSTAFQFEDRIGVGLRFGGQQKHDINFRFLHYSNADIKMPNDGLDIFMLSYGYAFR